MRQLVSRRDFLLAGSVGAGALLAGMGSAKTSALGGLGNKGTLVVARRHGTMNEMVHQCLDSLGGIKRFVPEGSKVAVKVVGSHDLNGITNPELIKQVVRLARTADPEEITVFEHPPPAKGAAWPFIEQAAKSAGAESILLRENPEDFIPADVPGLSLKSTMLARVLDEADVLINLPHLHSFGDGVSGGLKNHMGSILFRGFQANTHEGDLPVPDLTATPHSCGGGISQGVADLNTCPPIREKHRLTIFDALRPSVFGEWGVHGEYNGIIAGADPVATDHVASQVLRRYVPGVSQNPTIIRNAAALGLGTNDPTQIVFDERSVSAPIPELEAPLAMAAVAGIGMMALRRCSRYGQGRPRVKMEIPSASEHSDCRNQGGV